ncbi:MAG: ATP synthase subunit I [Rhodocyclaceae bacterium]
MFKIIFQQIIFSFLIAVGCYIFFGVDGFLTAILVAFAVILPNFLFALKLNLLSKRSILLANSKKNNENLVENSSQKVLTFFFGEFLKIVFTGLLLFLIFKLYKNMVPLCFAISLIANLQSILIAALLMKNKKI